MWLFRLYDAEIRRQIEEGREALLECLKPEVRAALVIKRHPDERESNSTAKPTAG